MRRTIKTMVVAMAAATAVGAGAQSNAEEMIYTGMVGGSSVTVALDVQGHQMLTGGHYSYDRYRKDIALTGSVDGQTVTMREPGGGAFTLRFRTADRNARPPLTFYNTTALVGSWTGGGRTLPVTLSLSSSGAVPAPGGRYTDVTDAPASTFEALAARFVHGVTTGDRAETASATSFPLRVNAGASYQIRNPSDLNASWARIFTPCVVAKLRRAVTHDMFVRIGEAMVADGTVWFDKAGATSVNVAGCTARAR